MSEYNEERIQRNLFYCSQNLLSINATLRMMLTLQLVRSRMDIAGLLKSGVDTESQELLKGFSLEVDQICKELQEQIDRTTRISQPGFSEELHRRYGTGRS